METAIVRTAFGAICFKLGIALGVLYFLGSFYARAHPETYGNGIVSVSEAFEISCIPAILGSVVALVF